MSTPALICDTGALLDYLSAQSPDHEAFRSAIDDARTRYVPALVLPELDYFLRRQRRAMHAFMADLSRGAFTYAPATATLLARAVEIDKRYSNLRLGLVDASIIALADELGVRRLATRDLRHFGAVTLRSGRRFDVVVQPSSPDHG